MNTRENTLAAIRYQSPAFVPLFDGTVWDAVQLGGNYKAENWTDDWGTVWQMTEGDMVPVDVTHPLEDLSRLDHYQRPDPWHLTWTEDDQRHFESLDREQMLIGGLHVKFLAERLACLMGLDNFLLSMYEEPERLQELINFIVEYNTVCIRRLVDLGIDTLHISEDLGMQHSLMMSPEMFRQFLLPAYERMFDEPLQRGVLIDFHTCGHVQEIVPDLAAVGVSILNPVQATANDQQVIKAAVMGKTALLGGINSTIVLDGTPDEVRAEVVRAFSILKDRGGWLAGPDQVVPGAPEDNLKALWDTCRELAPY